MNNKHIPILLLSSVLFVNCNKTNENYNSTSISENFVSSYLDVSSCTITRESYGQGYYKVLCSGNYYKKGDEKYSFYSEKYGDTDYNDTKYLMPVKSVVNDFQKINIYSDVDFPNVKAGEPSTKIVEVSFFSPYDYVKTHYTSSPKLVRINKMACDLTAKDLYMMYNEFLLHFTQVPTNKGLFTIFIEMEASNGTIVRGSGKVRW